MNIYNALLEVNLKGFVDNAKRVLCSFDVGDAVEILLLTVFLVVAIRFLRGRKAGALIVGIAICVVILIISEIFEFEALYKIFKSIVGSGTIVIMIIFQPEIREALEKLGSGSIHGIMSFSDRRRKKELYGKVIDEVCSAVEDFSKDYTGALIVIERTTRLSDIIQSGIKIDAEVGDQLIKNLFFNKAPLHDGAIIISDGRIAAAGCFLPLTRRSDVDPGLGTRHRAAIGISETSDAITIIVSEETGGISIAYDCDLIRNVDKEELKKFLLENLLHVSGNEDKSLGKN